jgi:hypothetical protein
MCCVYIDCVGVLVKVIDCVVLTAVVLLILVWCDVIQELLGI